MLNNLTFSEGDNLDEILEDLSKDKLKELLNDSLNSENKKYNIYPVYENKKLKIIKYKEKSSGLLKIKVVYEECGDIALVYGNFDENDYLLNGKSVVYEDNAKKYSSIYDLEKVDEYFEGSILEIDGDGEPSRELEGLHDNQELLIGKITDYINEEIEERDLRKVLIDGEYRYVGTITTRDINNQIQNQKGTEFDWDNLYLLNGKKTFYKNDEEYYFTSYNLKKEGEYYKGETEELEIDGSLCIKSVGLFEKTFFAEQGQVDVIDGTVVISHNGIVSNTIIRKLEKIDDDIYEGEITYLDKNGVETVKERGKFEVRYSDTHCEFEFNVFLFEGKKYVNGAESIVGG